MIQDIWNQEICNGDFVVSASKSHDGMVMGVMKDVKKKTRIRVDKVGGRWMADKRPYTMYTLERTFKLPDEMIVDNAPDLFRVMVDIRRNLKLPTNQGVASLDALRKMLQNSVP